MKIISSVRLDSKLSDNVNSKNYKAGDIVRGRIVNNENGIITMKTTDEQMLSVLLVSDEKLEEGSRLSFIINEINGDKIYAKIFKTEIMPNALDRRILNIMDELALSKNHINKDIILKLIKNLQHISKDKIEYISFLLKTVENAKQDKDEVLKNLLLSEENILESPIETLGKQVINEKEDKFLNLLLVSLKENNIESFINKIAELADLKRASEIELEGLVYQLNKTMNIIDTIDLDTIIYFLSKNIKITAQNVFVFNNFISQGKALDFYLSNIINILNKNTDEELSFFSKKLLKLFLKDNEINSESYNKQINKLTSVIENIEEALKRKNINEYGLKDNIYNLKTTINLLKLINQHINLLNIPLFLNDEKTSINIYTYKDGNKTIEELDTTILISLDLKNLGHIESLIQIINKSLNITFKTDNKDITNIISSNLKILKESLLSIGFNVNISVCERIGKKTNPMLFEDIQNVGKTYKYGIDVRL